MVCILEQQESRVLLELARNQARRNLAAEPERVTKTAHVKFFQQLLDEEEEKKQRDDEEALRKQKAEIDEAILDLIASSQTAPHF
eukprot:1086422-Amphidinium_carterae.1